MVNNFTSSTIPSIQKIQSTDMSAHLPSLEEIVQHYNLIPHFEGGYYKETYRSKEALPLSQLPSRFSEDPCNTKTHPSSDNANRNWSTGIFYLLPFNEKSRLHRIKSDEMWHFYGGDPLTLYVIPPHEVPSSTASPPPRLEKIVLGNDIKNGQHVQYVVEAGSWFGGTPGLSSCGDESGPTGYSFVGCTVSPGFDVADFEMASLESFTNLERYVDNQNDLKRLQCLVQGAE